MHHYVKNCFPIIPQELNELIISGKLPSYNHCIGRGKLLGEYFGTSLCEELGIKSLYIKDIISHSAIALRMYIVLDDYCKDSRLNINSILSYNEKLLEYVMSTLYQIDNNIEQKLIQYHELYKQSYLKCTNIGLFDSVMRKCMMIFLFYDIEYINEYGSLEDNKYFIEDYLFSLQLLDDFCDIEEDIINDNENIFFKSNIFECVNDISKYKYILVRHMLMIIYETLIEHYGKVKSNTCKNFMKYAYDWLSCNSLLCSRLPYCEYCNHDIRKVQFYGIDLSDAIKSHSNVIDHSCYSNIRAESMHCCYTECEAEAKNEIG